MVTWSNRNLLIATVLLAAIVGSVTGLATSYLEHPGAAPQARDVYLFVVDQNFNSSQTRGLTSDYIYSSSLIVVNKGDTVTIHFYNPTDKAHSFTLNAPYANDAVVAAQSSTIQNATITITTNQAGSFNFHCKFHQPQMIGAIIVQG
ncbi:MAG TPA: cupredoxin domain-containing protein [Candidatus Bathyarchaeia archaeon]|nr:cupredoxin domain-containing protein [Candidatus Bathyarchaeia archaeon]